MQCTPESNVHLHSHKAQRCYDDCTDSGYSGLFQSPQTITGIQSSRSSSPAEFNETPKENIRFTPTPKEKARDSVKIFCTDSKEVLQPGSWSETPKISKRDASLQRRLALCKHTAAKNTSVRSPSNTKSESSFRVRSEHWLSASFDSLDIVTDGATSTLKLDQDLSFSGRKRHLFTQVRTSTLEDGKVNVRHLSAFETSVSLSESDSCEVISTADRLDIATPGFGKLLPILTPEKGDTSVFSTPTFTQTPKYARSVCEDSGFGSATLDKSQDSSVDHEFSFQDLLTSSSRANGETPNLSDTKRHSRFQRQHRLSTLKEGGSQSEDDSGEKTHHQPLKCYSYSKEDEVFAEDATPSKAPPARCFNSVSSGEQDCTTPLSASIILDTTPNSAITTTPVSFSLTPALQLVHSMCQQRVQMFSGQIPSMKEELKMLKALIETPGSLRTSMPLAGLIGRRMGLRKVDILTELKKMNLKHILANILRNLNSESVHRCAQVCKSWGEIIQQDNRASQMRRSYQSEVEAALEHGGPVHVSGVETRVGLLHRSPLKAVQAQSRTTSYCTPQSASSNVTLLQHSTAKTTGRSKRDTFLKVAKTLFIDESLKPCPRCQDPARCHSVKGEGVCSRADCGFQFCILCLCAFHGSRECGSHSAGHHKSDALLPGSAQSKRNIRRL
ncbi:F-box only protein 43 isoform X1 [Nothobranchius furzeri]|uniref:Transcript variant X1 n=1 Tax=Nothobranchius furzeri TaxID=105023 RepID=A0A9D2YUS4_NOTFU|nr:transcript variant X2 [Nothobranchius furzeri]KAF7226249.1 transcript variant X1 [Nothobranchius furzeri]